MRHLGTIRLLVEWARWGIANNIDYPSMSPMFGERALKSPLYGIGHIPPDVARVEYCVCLLEWIDREILILRYQRRLSYAEMGERIHRVKSVAIDRLRVAENELHRRLHEKYCADRPISVYPVPDSKIVTSRSPA
jgi:hypothetical protein